MKITKNIPGIFSIFIVFLFFSQAVSAYSSWEKVVDKSDEKSQYFFTRVSYANGIFVVAGSYVPESGGNTQAMFMHSSDGINWQENFLQNSFNAAYLYDLEYINNQFVALGRYNTEATDYSDKVLILVSSDGKTWSQIKAYDEYGEMGGPGYAIAYGNNTYVMSIAGYLYYSSDLSNWTRASHDYTAYVWDDIIFANDRFIAIGGSNDASYRLSSSNGVNWQDNKPAGSPGGDFSIKYIAGSFYNTDRTSGNNIARSDSGSRWIDVTPLIFYDSTLDIDGNGEIFVVGGGAPNSTGHYGGSVMLTADFESWWAEKLDDEIEAGLISISHNNSAFVAISYHGKIYRARFDSSSDIPQLSRSSTIQVVTGETLSYPIEVKNMQADRYSLYVLQEDGSVDHNLPLGLSFDSETGLLSGIARQAGNYTLVFKAEDTSGDIGARTLVRTLELVIDETDNSSSDTAENQSSQITCNADELDSCRTIEACTAAGGYWNFDWCGATPQSNPDHFADYCKQGYSQYCEQGNATESVVEQPAGNDTSSKSSTAVVAADLVAGDRFGYSLDSDQDRLIVGAYNQDDGKGAAYIFKKENSNWVIEAKLTATSRNNNDFYGLSVALSGNWAVVGAQGDDSNNQSGGAVYIYRYDNDKWLLSHVLTPSDQVFESQFGSSLAMDGNRLVVGALGRNLGGSGSNFWSGRAYVFDYNPSNNSWTESIIYNPEPTDDDYFGRRVAIDGDRVLVSGTAGISHPQPAPGQAYVFQYQNGSWNLEQELLPYPELEHKANFGYGLVLQGDMAIVGAVSADYQGEDSGIAYVFSRQNNGWQQQQILFAEDLDSLDRFGMAAIHGDTLALGAYSKDVNGVESGAVYLFKYDGSKWQQIEKITPPQPQQQQFFSYHLSLSQNDLFVGAWGESDQQGSVYIYPLEGVSEITGTTADSETPEQADQNDCETASLDYNSLQMYFPVITYQPLFEDRTYYLDLTAVYRDLGDNELYFEVLDYNLLENYPGDTDCESSTLSASLLLSTPTLNFGTPEYNYQFATEFQLIESEGRFYLQLIDARQLN